MSDFSALFLDEPLSSSGGRGSSAIFLSLFGKYPAWTDFVTEFYPSRSLIAAEQMIREGLSSPGSLPIDHYFLWTRGTQFLVGSLWESQDQTGRKFPAVVCVHTINLGLNTVSRSVFDRVVEFRGICTSLVPEFGFNTHEASSSLQRAVRAEHAAMQTRLSGMLSSKGQSIETTGVATESVDAFMDSPEVAIEAGGGVSLLKFLLERLSEFSPSRYRTGNTTNGSVCLRLTSGGLAMREALFLWCRILQSHVHLKVPFLIVGSSSGDWVDIIVGQPKPHDLACIRKSKEELDRQSGASISSAATTSVSDEILNEFIESLRKDQMPTPAHGGTKRSATGILPDKGNNKRQNGNLPWAFGTRMAVGLMLLVFSVVILLLWISARKKNMTTGDNITARGSDLLLSQPEDKEVTAGDDVFFLARVSDKSGVRFSWVEKSSGQVVGTNDTLWLSTTGSARIGGSFEYRAIVKDSQTAVTSRWARLVVKVAPANPGNRLNATRDSKAGDLRVVNSLRITRDLPPMVEVADGKVFQLVAELSSTNTEVSWYFGRERMEGLNSSNLVVSGASSQHSGSYMFIASNASGSVTSSPTKLVVIQKPLQTATNSPDRVLKAGEPVMLPLAKASRGKDIFFSVGTSTNLCVDGVLTDGWRWYRDGERIGSVESNCLLISSVDNDSGGTYRAERISSPEIFQEFRVWIAMTNQIGMDFVWVPNLPGTKKGGWVGKFEVTQAQYETVMRENPSKHKTSPNNPVDSVNLADASLFCQELSKRLQISRGTDSRVSRYSLPTESQWEYAARGAELTDAVTSLGRSSMRTGPEAVGSRNPNQQGLFDTRGNLWEWCLPDSGEVAARGGSYGDFSERLGSAEGGLATRKRNVVPRDAKLKNIGFRCVLLAE